MKTTSQTVKYETVYRGYSKWTRKVKQPKPTTHKGFPSILQSAEDQRRLHNAFEIGQHMMKVVGVQ